MTTGRIRQGWKDRLWEGIADRQLDEFRNHYSCQKGKKVRVMSPAKTVLIRTQLLSHDIMAHHSIFPQYNCLCKASLVRQQMIDDRGNNLRRLARKFFSQVPQQEVVI